ncbi:Pentatricopeptide repeat-containing protein, chloroplastic [Tolypocladium ophioglossoides CBS 100239]|uniref:Pentatricopeptide repeat-containing protein, chloroplastic n=1 Tax=Tolypocladium ophioglossoides (strain CBS 100239) TaxID=1163406 RepID=A0A0L0N7A0_TOLOC|nr:Pentatricopeptide repeat-containing protein, chloroplastic [Tolypocladium ophioglossoides CBS 100239]
MAAACMNRASFSRLSVSARILPPLRPSSNQHQLRRFAAVTHSLAPQTIREPIVQGREEWHVHGDALHSSSQPSESHASSRPELGGQHGEDGAKNDNTCGRDLKHGPERKPPRLDQAHKPSRFSGPTARRALVASSFTRSNLSGHGRLTPEAWNRLKDERQIYQQWGYIRHQYPKSEVLAVRRAFKSWKIKLHNILKPKVPTSWPWREDGKWLFELDTMAAMRKAWESLNTETRRQKWPLTMLSTMHLEPDKASLVLEATMNPLPPGYAIHDVLLFIAQRVDISGFRTLRERTIHAEETLHLVAKIVEDTPAGHVPFGQRTFGLLACKLPSDQAEELYTILKRADCKLHANTLMHFARKFAGNMAHKMTAFEILQGLADAGADLNEARPASVITSLLHCKVNNDGLSHPKQPFSPRDALQVLVEKGFSPNVANATAFLDSLCQQNDAEEAIRLALLFSECGVPLDTKAWATVFRGAKNSLKVVNVIKALDVARAADAPYVDVLNNALHCIFYFAEMESREKRFRAPWVLPIFEPMLRIYAKKFDLEPLQRWLPDSLPLMLAQKPSSAAPSKGLVTSDGHQQRRWDFQQSILPVVDKFFSVGEGERLQPNSTTIAMMLRAYIKSLQQSYDLVSFYGFFKSRLEEESEGGSSATQLVRSQGSLIHDTFIMAMTEHKGLSRRALQVFGDKLKDNLKAGASGGGKPRLEGSGSIATCPIHPAPSVLTFTILIRGLMHGSDRLLAQQVVQVMREHGIEPNLVTWNTLTKGYASMQNISQVVATLQDMERAGFKADIFTFKAFGKLKDQTKALKMMEGIIDANRRKLAGDELYQ